MYENQVYVLNSFWLFLLTHLLQELIKNMAEEPVVLPNLSEFVERFNDILQNRLVCALNITSSRYIDWTFKFIVILMRRH